MFKLTVINGPARGTAYTLKSGEMTLGRVTGNDIVLSSQKVSKKHCIVTVNDSEVTVRDAGSSNGTFVNGVLTKQKKMNPGDRVSVGEYVLELSKVEEIRAASNVVPLRGVSIGTQGGMPMAGGMPGFGGPTSPGIPVGAAGSAPVLPVADIAPKDLKGKLQYYFEKYILNFLYNLNEKQEWRSLLSALFFVFTIGCAALSVYPVIDRVMEKLDFEAKERALLIARQMVDRNSGFIYEKLDSKVEVSYAEREKGVLSAYILDMEGRVLAPARKLNQYLVEADEAAFSAIARTDFNKFEKLEQRMRNYGDKVAVAAPLRIFSASQGKNVTVAVGMVFFDRSQVLFDSGTIMLAYIQAFILSAILAVLVFFSVYRLTLKPLTTLNEEIDQVLKGSSSSVNRKFKMEEIDSMIDIINATLQRAANSSSGGGSAGDTGAEDMLRVMKHLSDRMNDMGMIIVSPERRILHMNAVMEEITGIRADKAVGDEVSNVARDAAFNSLVEDMVGKAAFSTDAIAEDFEFSGTNYKVDCFGLGSAGSFKAYAMTVVKQS